MSFNSIIFILFFLPILLGLHYICKEKYRNSLLLIASIIFYIWTGISPIFIIIIILSINYLLGFLISKNKFNNVFLLILSLTLNIGVLLYYKYSNFFITNMNILFKEEYSTLNIIVPLGLSYITFQQITYIVDIYRKKIIFDKNFINYALYILFFPKIIAGPITKYADIKEQFVHREYSSQLFSNGIYRFSMGLGKKIIIASVLQTLVDEIFAVNPENIRTPVLWLGLISYTLQIYFDFSGYTDMAIGLGNMLSFKLPENFNRPYIATSINDFWKRWHISLTSFLREYIYFPLGGSRVGNFRALLNILIIFLISGIWHGAAFTFIIWGAYHGVLMIIEKLFLGKVLKKLPKIMSQAICFITVSIGWVFFRSDSLEYAITYIERLFSIGGADFVSISTFTIDNKFIVMFVIALLIALLPSVKSKFLKKESLIPRLTSLLILIYSIAIIASGSFKPFIYFKF